jgi:CheY-like chemotaxis protein
MPSAARQAQLMRQELLRALSEVHGLPAIDLSEQVVPLAALRLLPIEIARERQIFAFRIEGDQLLLAMSAPLAADATEELEFVTGKKIQPYIAHDEALRTVTEAAYERLQQGEEFYVAEHAGGSVAAAGQSMSAQLRSVRVPSERAISAVLDEAFAHRMPPSQPPSMPKLNASTRVLVALREGEHRAALERALGEAGVALALAADGAKALQSLRDEPPQLLVLESDLPGIDGLDVCRRLRGIARFEALPIVVVAPPQAGGWRLAHDLREGYGVEHVFEMPLDIPKLTQTVRMLLLGQPVPEEPLPLSEAAEARWNGGMEAFHAGDLETAVSELEVAVELDPDAFELRYHLGLLYGRRDDLFASIRALEAALRMQPRHFFAIKNLATVLARAGFHQRALDAWERAMTVAPDEETRGMIREHLVDLIAGPPEEA